MMQFGYRPQLRMPPPFGHMGPPGFGQPNFAQPPPFGPPGFAPPGQQNFQPNALGQPNMMPGDVGFDGKMLRKAMARKTIDYNPSAVRYLEVINWLFDLN